MKTNSTNRDVLTQRFKSKRFDNYKVQSEANSKVYRACLEYAENFKENYKAGKGLFLTGDVGTGKTHLAAAIVNYIADKIKSPDFINVEFITSVDLLMEIKSSFDAGNKEEVIDKYENCELLIIDDLGMEKQTEWAQEMFCKLIDDRYTNLMPVIITTNLTDEEIKKQISKRVISRIYEMCAGIKLTGKDYRLEAI